VVEIPPHTFSAAGWGGAAAGGVTDACATIIPPPNPKAPRQATANTDTAVLRRTRGTSGLRCAVTSRTAKLYLSMFVKARAW
jgi:hypothetical protein